MGAEPNPLVRLLYAPTTRGGGLMALGCGAPRGPRAGGTLPLESPALELDRYLQGEDAGEAIGVRLKEVAAAGGRRLGEARWPSLSKPSATFATRT